MKSFSLHSLWVPTTRIAFAALAIYSLSSCQLAKEFAKHDSSKADEADSKEELYPEPKAVQLNPEARTVNDAARYLAGLPALDDQDGNKKWRSEDFWKAHRTGMDKMWKEFASKRGSKVRKWAAAEVADVATTPVVFQPFGGPDFTFSHLLFPKAETFVVCGTAPCIDIPKFEAIPPAAMADMIFALREATAAALKTESSTSGQPAVAAPQSNGALPMLLAFGARTGHVVESVELMPSDGSTPPPVAPGQMSLDLPSMDGSARRAQPSSACVINMRTAEGKPCRLFYFQQDLSDEGLPESAALLRYLNKQSHVAVVVNESAHELHQENTLRIQKYIASHAVALIQDPSGVPFRHFSQSAWNVQKYGSYKGAPPAYKTFDQPELIAAFNDESSKPQPLPFGSGPIHKEMPAALLIARPLITNTADIPTHDEVTPLAEPSAGEVPAVSAAPAAESSPTPTTASAPSPAGGSAAEPAPSPSPGMTAISSTQPPPAIGLPGVGPLAPIDLAPKK